MKAKNNNSVQYQYSNKSKPLLADIILTENMKQLEVDIAIIKKDIEYMKNRLWPSSN